MRIVSVSTLLNHVEKKFIDYAQSRQVEISTAAENQHRAVLIASDFDSVFSCRKHIEKKNEKSTRNETAPLCEGDRLRAQTNH